MGRYAPQRTLYLAFGHDEEVGGRGAKALAETLLAEGVHVHCILDEGGAVLVDGFPLAVATPLALVGLAEKACSFNYLSTLLLHPGLGCRHD